MAVNARIGGSESITQAVEEHRTSQWRWRLAACDNYAGERKDVEMSRLSSGLFNYRMPSSIQDIIIAPFRISASITSIQGNDRPLSLIRAFISINNSIQDIQLNNRSLYSNFRPIIWLNYTAHPKLVSLCPLLYSVPLIMPCMFVCLLANGSNCVLQQ